MSDAIVPFWVCLALGCGIMLALGAVLYLAIVLPRRVVHLVLEARTSAVRARSESAAIEAEARIVVSHIVGDLRAYHREMAASASALALTVRYLSALVDWFDARAHARYAPPGGEATQRPGGEAVASPALPSPDAPTVAPPESVPALSSDPAYRAAGLGGPNAAPMTKSGPPRSSGAPVRQPTMAGLGALDAAGDAGPPRPPLSRRPLGSAPTLPSAVSSTTANVRQAAPVKEPPRRDAHRGDS